MKKQTAFIIAHAGVGSSIPTDEKREKMKQVVKNCVLDAWNALKSNSEIDACVDSVEKGITYMENSGSTNSGLGSKIQTDGVKRMDASIMRGRDLQYGAVGSLRGYRNPISLARILMERGDGFNMYAHDFASKYAEEAHLIKICDEQDQNPLSKKSDNAENNEDIGEKSDTVGCVSRDFEGRLCAGTSTGGRGDCPPGRIGDSCIIGAGNYCNPECAVSLTGWGENIVMMNSASRVVNLVTHNKMHPQQAAEIAVKEYTEQFPEEKITVGIIAIDKKGRYGIAFRGQIMNWAAIVIEKKPMVIYGNLRGEVISEEI